ncbi:MAG: hypothetical protein ACIALR_15805 [Blastopirellula sp. JB062]
MSYVLSPILVDFAKLEKAIGSGDASLIEAVKANNPERFEDDEEWDAEDEGMISLSDAIKDLVMGNELDDESGSQYGYALEEIAAHLGTSIPPTEWGGVRWAAIQECGLVRLMATQAPVPLPDLEDFPALGHIRQADLAQQVNEFEQRIEQATDAAIQALLREFLDWLKQAQAQKTDVLLTYY